MQHFLSYPTNSTYACGADAVGRRRSRIDTNPFLTECVKCMRSVTWSPSDGTKAQRCDAYRELDFKHGTPEDSPLHHDNRCPHHATN